MSHRMSVPDRFSGDPVIVLRHARHEAVLLPGLGGRLASLRWLDDSGRWHDILAPLDVPGFEPHHWPKAGAFPMLPFTNRMPPEGVTTEGTTAHPEVGPAGVAVHGVAHRRAWQVVEQTGSSARLAIHVASGVEGWPWAWTAVQDVALTSHGLRWQLQVTNPGAVPMPLSMGWHPYLLADARADALKCQVAQRLTLDPAGRADRPADVHDTSMLPGDTSAFSGWSGSARVHWRPGLDIGLRCEGATHLVVHRPLSGRYLCVEPVTVLPGHLGAGQPGAGVLRAGGTKTLSVSCAVLAG